MRRMIAHFTMIFLMFILSILFQGSLASAQQIVPSIVVSRISPYEPENDLELLIADATFSQVTHLTQLTFNNNFEDQPRLSSDGTRIVFRSNRDSTFPATTMSAANGYELYAMNTDGTNVVRLTNNLYPDQHPAWSPDGTKIAFASNRDGNSEIYTMNADGSNQTNISNNMAGDYYPIWSPDGTRIAFISIRNGSYSLYLMDPDGTNPRQLTPNGESFSHPAWSPDGTMLAMRGPNEDIYRINIDGSNLVAVTNETTDKWQIIWFTNEQLAFATLEGLVVIDIDGTNRILTGIPLTVEMDYDALPSWNPLSSLNTPTPTFTPAPLQRLRLTSVCSADPTVTRRWHVRNSNPYEVMFTWDVYNTTQTGTLTIPAANGSTPAEVFFETQTVPNTSNTVRIFVDGAQQDVKASSGAVCSP
jgi:Tol biopolymer transport system component